MNAKMRQDSTPMTHSLMGEIRTRPANSHNQRKEHTRVRFRRSEPWCHQYASQTPKNSASRRICVTETNHRWLSPLTLSQNHQVRILAPKHNRSQYQPPERNYLEVDSAVRPGKRFSTGRAGEQHIEVFPRPPASTCVAQGRRIILERRAVRRRVPTVTWPVRRNWRRR